MAKELKTNIGTTPEAPRVVLYGVDGIGKTTFASKMKDPYFIRTEDGMQAPEFANVAKSDLITKYEDYYQVLLDVLTAQHEFKSLVIDSIDWAENLMQNYVAEQEKKPSVADIGFGKGYRRVAVEMFKTLQILDQINKKRNMTICLLGHAKIVRYNSPDKEPYDRYYIDLHDQCSSMVYEWATAVFFVNYVTRVKEVTDGKFQSIGNNVETLERVVYAQERPAFRAKNRYGLELAQPFDWIEIAKKMFNKKEK